MDDDALAALEHENFIASMALVGSGVEGGVVRRHEGVALIASGLPVRLFNLVLIEGAGAPPAAIAAAVETLRGRGDDFVVNLRIGQDDGVVPVMAELGLAPLSTRPWMPGMALHPLPAERGPETDLDIRLVTDAEGFDDHMLAAAVGFEMEEALVRRIMASALASGSGIAVYVGYADGQAVTSGIGVQTGRTIGIYNIATVPSARRRGYGAAMTERIAADAVDRGCDVAVLQASEMGLPIYERLGYRTVVEYMGYVDPPSGS